MLTTRSFNGLAFPAKYYPHIDYLQRKLPIIGATDLSCLADQAWTSAERKLLQSIRAHSVD